MYDPFPFKPSPVLSAATASVTGYFNFVTLPLHIHEILLGFTFYHVVCNYASPALSARLFPRTYPTLNRRTKLNWDVHVTSLVQSTLISGLALWVMARDRERANMDWRERVWGYTGGVGFIESMAAGYFLWDLWVSVLHVDVFGLGLLAHAVSALWVFGMGFRPFVNYYAPTFILYELSSPFLNIHWFCDKLDMTGSTLQLYNGILLMASFFGSRLVWGVWQTGAVFYDIYRALQYQQTREGLAWLAMHAELATTKGLVGGEAAEVMRYTQGKLIPTWLGVTYLSANVVLTVLNVMWFGRMIETIRARFPPPFGTRKEVVLVGRGVDDKGVKSVQIEATSLPESASDAKKRKGRKSGGGK